MATGVVTLNQSPASKRPWHDRWGLSRFRSGLRGLFFRLLRRVAETDDARQIHAAALGNLLPARAQSDSGWPVDEQPYPDLGRAQTGVCAADRDDVVIISARFRSGSTLLWNLFRAVPSCTSYYEPFNERRWFDPSARGNHTDPTHRGVDDYWREYQGLDELGRHYREDWIRRDLFMGAGDWNPDMRRYVEVMIDRAPGRPVLQFNRIDFRLAWFRHNFPRAKVLHLYRHPRDQWMSSLVDVSKAGKDTTMAAFAAHDHYYLRMWASDLKYHFPFLDEARIEHPYQMFYLIWKLSYLHGRRHAHVSLAYEDLLQDPAARLERLFADLNVDPSNVAALTKLVEQPRSGRWRKYAPEEWFQKHESRCERTLAEFFGNRPHVPGGAMESPRT